jgi:dTDP-4-dehydrorhamnose reductase
MKVLVTGSSGQVARSLVERAAARESVEVIAVGRPQLDLERPGSAEQIVDSIRPDVIVNAAAYTAVDQAEDEPDRAFRINADAAGELAAAARRIDSPIVQISTDYVFDGSAAEPCVEAARPDPINAYGRSKLAGEEQVRSATPKFVIVRTGGVFSPFGRNFVKSMIAAASAGNPLRVVDDQHVTPTSALDLGEAILVMLEQSRWRGRFPNGELYHVAGTTAISWYGFARMIMDECRNRGLPAAEVLPIDSADWGAKAARPANSALDSSKFKQEFGYSCAPLETALGEVIGRLRSGAAGSSL